MGMATISSSFSYGSVVQSNDNISNKGYSSLGYSYTNAYKTVTSDAYVFMYVDKQGSNGVYGIQVFSSEYKLDDLMLPKQCTYTSEIASGMARQLPEWVNAFRRYKGIKVMCTIQGNTAQAHSDKMVSTGTLDTSDSDGSMLERMDAAYGEVYFGGENIGSGSVDAFGYVSDWIDDTTGTKAENTNYTKAYNNMIRTQDPDGSNLPRYYICGGFAYNSSTRHVTYATLDFWGF